MRTQVKREEQQLQIFVLKVTFLQNYKKTQDTARGAHELI